MSTHRETLQRFFPAMFGRDRDTLRELLAPDVVWHVPPFVLERFGNVEGRDTLISWLCDAGEEFYDTTTFQLSPEVEAVDGDQAIVIGWITGKTSSGKPYGNRYAFGFHFRGSQISGVWEVLDSAHFEKQMG